MRTVFAGACTVAALLLPAAGAHAGLTFVGCIRDNEPALTGCASAAPALRGARGPVLAPGAEKRPSSTP